MIGFGTRIVGLLFAVIMVVATFSAKWAGATRTGALSVDEGLTERGLVTPRR